MRANLHASLLLLIAFCSAALAERCIPASQLNSTAGASVVACCKDDWATSFAGIPGVVEAGVSRTYCGTLSNRTLDTQLAKSNVTWYAYCAQNECPMPAGVACCLKDPTKPPPSPIPSPSPPPYRATLPSIQAPLWALYLCPNSPASAPLFGYNFDPSSTTPAPAIATAKVASSANTTTPTAQQLLRSCPASPPSTSPQLFQDAKDGTTQVPRYVPSALTILRKAGLGPVKLTLSVSIDNGTDGLIYDRKVVTLDADPTPGNVPGAQRRLLGQAQHGGLWAPAGLDEAGGEEGMLGRPGRRLQRGSGGGGGHGGGGGGSRGRTKRYKESEFNSQGFRRPLTTDIPIQGALYAGASYSAVAFWGYYTYRQNFSTPYLGSTRWTYPTTELKDRIMYGLPSGYYNLFQNGSIAMTTYGYSGRSVYKAGSPFQYMTSTDWPLPTDTAGEVCEDCGQAYSTTCCGRSYNNSALWQSIYARDTQRGTILTCDMQLDIVMDVPLYLPYDIANVTITVHSIEAAPPAGNIAASSSPCVAPADLADPRSPPLFLSFLPIDQVDLRVVQSNSCYTDQSNDTIKCTAYRYGAGSNSSKSSSAAVQVAAWGVLLWVLAACLGLVLL